MSLLSLREMFINSWALLKSSVAFLLKNKDLIVLPVASLVACIILVAFTALIGVFALPHMDQFKDIPNWVLLLSTSMLYLLVSFITIFFNTTLIACATERLQAKPCDLSQGMKLAASHWRSLISWTIIGAIIGAIIHALERSHSIVADIIALMFGIAWSIAAYFVLPVMIFDDVGPVEAIKRSIKIFGRSWRKVVGVNLIIVLFVASCLLVLYGINYVLPGEQMLFIEIGAVILFLTILFSVTIGAAFNCIVRSALYLHYHKNVTATDFAPEILDQAFKKQKRRFGI